MIAIKKCVFLILVLSLFLTACTNIIPETSAPEQTEPSTTAPPAPADPTTAPTEPADPLDALRGEMDASSCAFAVAYLGNTYTEEKNYTELLSSLAPQLCQKYPFLLEIGSENIVDLGWYEIYCIIPADPGATVRIHKAVESSDADWEYSELLYESQTGDPVLLICNCTEFWPDTQVTVISNGTETVWHPCQSPYGCVDLLVNESGDPLFLDISSYTELLLQQYKDIASWEGYVLPTKETLVGTAWGFEGTESNEDRFSTCLLAFDKETALVRWNDGTGEGDHEINNIPWDINYVNDFAVLTLDLGVQGGIRSYDLLYDEEYGSLYTILDLSSGEVKIGSEIPYRFLSARSLDAPDPMGLVGNWVRFRWEFEGNEAEDTEGLCTLEITGDTPSTLTVSFTDRESPNSSYQNKPMHIHQGVIYEGCGNLLWLADVVHTGPWGTTYALTLLEDNTLLVQSYWEVDGAPTVSYAWYRLA